MKRTFISGILFIVFLSVAAGSDAATVNVVMKDISFQPPSVAIKVGDTVTWTNNDFGVYSGITHTTTSGMNCTHNTTGEVWDSGPLTPGESFSHTFNTQGSFPFFCSFHCATNNMVGIVIVNAATMPVPDMALSFSQPTVASPLLSTNPPQAEPIGVGSAATGGNTLSLLVALDQFAGPVDLYFFIVATPIDPNNIYQLTSAGTLQTLSQGLAPWMLSTVGPVNTTLLSNLPTSALPAGQYLFAVAAFPAGDRSLTKFYVWITSVTL